MDTPNLLTSLSRTNLFKFSFMKKIVGEWNSLPLDIRGASSVEDEGFYIFNSLNFCIYIFSRYIGRSEFPPRMVLWRFLRILPISTQFLCKYFIDVC